MSLLDNNILAVVPARGGSKGIPHKNLQPVCGVSLVGHAAAVAKSLPWIDRAIVSTDDTEIAAEAVRHGLEAPFMRPDEISGDKASSVDMWRHAWLTSEAHYGMRFDVSILLEPTSPLRRPEDVERTVRTLLESDAAAAATVSPTPAHFTPHKTLQLDDGVIGFYLDEGARFAIRQYIPQYYHRNGICYALRRETLVENGHIIEENCLGVIIERPVVNIDDRHELEYAAWLMEKEGRCNG